MGEARAEVGPFPTTYRFTGQRQEMVPGWVNGLDFYNSRWYDPYLNRWLQLDMIIPNPGNPLDYDRYAYVRNAPTMYTDPSGHVVCTDDTDETGTTSCFTNDHKWERRRTGLSGLQLTVYRYCKSSGMGCWGSDTQWVDIDLSFLKSELGYDPGWLRLPIHSTFSYDPDKNFPWEGVANVMFNENRSLHPSSPQYRNNPAALIYLNTHWLKETIAMMRTAIARRTFTGPNGDRYRSCFGYSPNHCAMGSGYASPYRQDNYASDLVYLQYYVLAYLVVNLGLGSEYSYTEFRILDEVDYIDGGDGEDTVEFDTVPPPFDWQKIIN